MAILSGIGIENFRVFKEMTYFEFAPLTILTGANNSGKSTVLKALLLLRDSAKGNKAIKRLDFTASDEHKLGDFNTSKNNEKNLESISFQLSFDLEKDNFLKEFIEKSHLKLDYIDEKLKWQRAKFKLVDGENLFDNHYQFLNHIVDLVEANRDNYEKRKQESLENAYPYEPFDEIDRIYNIKKENGKLFVVTKLSDTYFFKNNKEIEENLLDEFAEEILNPLFIKHIENGKVVPHFPNDLEDFQRFNYSNNVRIVELFKDNSIPKYEKIIDYIKGGYKNSHWSFMIEEEPTIDDWLSSGVLSIFNYFHNLEYLEITDFEYGTTEDFQVYSTQKIIDIADFLKFTYIPPVKSNQQRLYTYQSQGTNFNQLLVRYSKSDRIYRKQIDFINKWIGKEGFNIADEITFIPIETYGNAVRIIKNGKRLELADLGFGISQLIPLLMHIAISEGNYILLEEPENSLHPNLQSKLADMLIDAQQTFGVRFIIETHSEYLIRRLQILTAEQVITPDYTSMYYFYEPERVPKGKNQVEKITIHKNGSLDNDFGSGFFDEADNIAIDLYNIQKKKV